MVGNQLIPHLFIILLTLITMAILAYWQHLRIKKALMERDKILQSFKRIYQLILEDLDYNGVVQRIADIIPHELKFATCILSIYDDSKRTIKVVTPSKAEWSKIIEIPISDENNLMAKALRDHRTFSTSDIYDVVGPVISKDEARKMQNIMSTTSTSVYPIFMKDEPLGVFITSTQMAQNELSAYEKEVIDSFVNLVALALQDAKIYTRSKSTSEKLERANLKLMEVDELKDDFVSITSHELRTPMTAIKSYAWMALYKSDVPLSDKLKRYLNRVLTSTDRLINLVNDMLNISRIESGKVEVVPEVSEIKQLVLDTFNEIAAKATERQIQLQVDGPNPPKVFADPAKVHQILLNLFGNALKFSPDGGLIQVTFFSDGRYVETSIKDNGVGIAKEDMSRLFKKFGRLDNSYVATATSGGTGLGLYICKSLVELMHGTIWANSEGLNKGTTFTFSLPIATSEVVSSKHIHNFKMVDSTQAKLLEPVAI